MVNKIKHLCLILKHKWYVFKIGRQLDVPLWRLIKHDMSKFLPSEFPHYVIQFYGNFCQKRDNEKHWKRSLELHYKRNDHHWEHWNKFEGAMAPEAIREMLADWISAEIVYDNRNYFNPNLCMDWFRTNYNKVAHVDSTTILFLNQILQTYFNVEIKDIMEKEN